MPGCSTNSAANPRTVHFSDDMSRSADADQDMSPSNVDAKNLSASLGQLVDSQNVRKTVAASKKRLTPMKQQQKENISTEHSDDDQFIAKRTRSALSESFENNRGIAKRTRSSSSGQTSYLQQVKKPRKMISKPRRQSQKKSMSNSAQTASSESVPSDTSQKGHRASHSEDSTDPEMVQKRKPGRPQKKRFKQSKPKQETEKPVNDGGKHNLSNASEMLDERSHTSSPRRLIDPLELVQTETPVYQDQELEKRSQQITEERSTSLGHVDSKKIPNAVASELEKAEEEPKKSTPMVLKESVQLTDSEKILKTVAPMRQQLEKPAPNVQEEFDYFSGELSESEKIHRSVMSALHNGSRKLKPLIPDDPNQRLPSFEKLVNLKVTWRSEKLFVCQEAEIGRKTSDLQEPNMEWEFSVSDSHDLDKRNCATVPGNQNGSDKVKQTVVVEKKLQEPQVTRGEQSCQQERHTNPPLNSHVPVERNRALPVKQLSNSQELEKMMPNKEHHETQSPQKSRKALPPQTERQENAGVEDNHLDFDNEIQILDPESDECELMCFRFYCERQTKIRLQYAQDRKIEGLLSCPITKKIIKFVGDHPNTNWNGLKASCSRFLNSILPDAMLEIDRDGKRFIWLQQNLNNTIILQDVTYLENQKYNFYRILDNYLGSVFPEYVDEEPIFRRACMNFVCRYKPVTPATFKKTDHMEIKEMADLHHKYSRRQEFIRKSSAEKDDDETYSPMEKLLLAKFREIHPMYIRKHKDDRINERCEYFESMLDREKKKNKRGSQENYRHWVIGWFILNYTNGAVFNFDVYALKTIISEKNLSGAEREQLEDDYFKQVFSL